MHLTLTGSDWRAYHRLELTNIDLLSTLPWLNISNLKYKQTYNTVCSVFVCVDLYADVNLTEALSLDTKDWNVLFLFLLTDFYMYIVFMWFIVLNVVGLYHFYLCISFSLSCLRVTCSCQHYFRWFMSCFQDFMGKSDPYLQFSRQMPDGMLQVVFRTEVFNAALHLVIWWYLRCCQCDFCSLHRKHVPSICSISEAFMLIWIRVLLAYLYVLLVELQVEQFLLQQSKKFTFDALLLV